MTTPTHQPQGASLQNLVPSSSFLQQLLEEIHGAGTPAVLCEGVRSKGTPCSSGSSNGSRRTSSVWVGGSSIAQEARERLRAADEARLRKAPLVGHADVPNAPRPDAAPRTLGYHSAPSSSGKISASLGPHEPLDYGVSFTDTARTTSNASQDGSCLAPSSPHLPGPNPFDTRFSSYNALVRTDSPLMFCDIDSDISATPSPTEPPTSALSAVSTDATSTSGSRPRTPITWRSRTPEKRPRSPDIMSQSLSKRTRTMTLPDIRDDQIAQLPRRASWRYSVSSDNRSLIQGSAFLERSPVLLEQIESSMAHAVPEVSSFRPEATGPQGVPPVSVTPSRPLTRRSSAVEQSPSPEPEDTPTYARALHLVDTDVSIYKMVHGDAWRGNSLCLYCFRQHGDFSKLTLRGYEVCGRNEALESHYWESDGDY